MSDDTKKQGEARSDREAILARRRQLLKAALASVGLGAALVSCREDAIPVPCLSPVPPPSASASPRPCLSVAVPQNDAEVSAAINAQQDAGNPDAKFDAAAEASAAPTNRPPLVEPPRPCLSPPKPPPRPCLKPALPKDFKR